MLLYHWCSRHCIANSNYRQQLLRVLQGATSPGTFIDSAKKAVQKLKCSGKRAKTARVIDAAEKATATIKWREFCQVRISIDIDIIFTYSFRPARSRRSSVRDALSSSSSCVKVDKHDKCDHVSLLNT